MKAKNEEQTISLNVEDMTFSSDVEDTSFKSQLMYRLKDRPPIAVLISSSLQHIILALPGGLTCSSIVADVACVPYDHPIRAQLFCATLCMCGISTIMQTAFGIRLPIFQGSSSSFIVPLLALKGSPEGSCLSSDSGTGGGNSSITTSSNETNALNPVDETEMYTRLQRMSGALMLASLVEICVGGLGAFRVLSSFIGPITIATTISLIGITLCKLPIIYGRPQFSIAFGCMGLVTIFILYMQNVRIPLPKCSKDRSQPRKYFALFQLLPLMTVVVIMWSLTWVLTLCGVFTDDKNDPEFLARADARIDLIHQSPWFQLSYPGMFGFPRKHLALTTSFLVAVLASMVESVGDYYAAHKVCEIGPPSHEAISRGIFMEGIASLISGAMGVGHATTSYSGNIGVLTLTQTASRSVMYVAGTILIAMSLIGKLGAALTTVPNPILGGISIIIVGSLVSIGLSNLSRVNMKTTRNMLVVGVSLASGLIMPNMQHTYPDLFETGNTDVDQMIHVLLGTPMFVGAVVAMILDNTAPGSRQSRGLEPRESDTGKRIPGDLLLTTDVIEDNYTWICYPALIKRLPFLRYIPFLPKS